MDRHGMPHEDREWSLDAKPKRGSQIAPMRVCKACYAYVAATARTCPHCGAEAPRVVQEKLPEADIVDVALAKRTEEARIRETPLPEWAEALEGEPRAVKTFQSLLRPQIDKKYKPGWVAAMYRNVCKRHPPEKWLNELLREPPPA